jgi:hypothetical protein
MRVFLVLFASVALMASALVGCGGTAEVMNSSGIDVPDWVMNQAKGCGVGSAKIRGSNIGNARDFSAERARADLAAQLETKVKRVVKDYAEEGETDGKDFNEELIRKAAISVVDTTLNGTSVDKFEARGQNAYALVCLDVETFANIFDQMNSLGQKQRKALRKRAENAWDDLDKRTEDTE